MLTGTSNKALTIPRDRAGTFDPKLIAKYQRRFPDFDAKIISMYARGIMVREIQGHLEELYGLDVSPDLISAVTDAGGGRRRECQEFCAVGRFHQLKNRSPKMTANCVFASTHSRGARFHCSAALLRTRYNSFIAASSPGKCPRERTARRSFELRASIAFVV